DGPCAPGAHGCRHRPGTAGSIPVAPGSNPARGLRFPSPRRRPEQGKAAQGAIAIFGSGIIQRYASSAIGRAAVSKTAGWGFESLLACHLRVASRVNSRVEQPGTASAGDMVKYALALLLVAAGVFAFYWFETQWPGPARVGVVVLGVVAAAAVFMT